MPYHDMYLIQKGLERRLHRPYKRTKDLLTQYYTRLENHYANLKADFFLPEREPLPKDPHYDDPIDALSGWIRCPKCGTETSLDYRRGTYPFGYLRCICPLNGGCGTVISPAFDTSGCIARFPSTLPDPVPVPPLRGAHRNQVPFFAVCPGCGLSHRARIVRKPLWVRAQKNDVSDPTLIGFEHIECVRCRRGVVDDRTVGKGLTTKGAESFQRFSIRFDPAYHIDGSDENGYYASITHKEEPRFGCFG